jgi:hypothetical protein
MNKAQEIIRLLEGDSIKNKVDQANELIRKLGFVSKRGSKYNPERYVTFFQQDDGTVDMAVITPEQVQKRHPWDLHKNVNMDKMLQKIKKLTKNLLQEKRKK